MKERIKKYFLEYNISRTIARAGKETRRDSNRMKKLKIKRRHKIKAIIAETFPEKRREKKIVVSLSIIFFILSFITTILGMALVVIDDSVVYAMEESNEAKIQVSQKIQVQEETEYSMEQQESRISTMQEYFPTMEDIKSNMSIDMDISKPTGMGKWEFYLLVSKMKDSTGYFQRNAEVIWNISQELGINELMICGIVALESGYGEHSINNNYMGHTTKKGPFQSFDSEEEGIITLANNLSQNYMKEEGKYYKGKTIRDVGRSYSPTGPKWGDKVYSIAIKILNGQSGK